MLMHTKYRHHRRCRRRGSHLEVAGRCKNHQVSFLRRCRPRWRSVSSMLLMLLIIFICPGFRLFFVNLFEGYIVLPEDTTSMCRATWRGPCEGRISCLNIYSPVRTLPPWRLDIAMENHRSTCLYN